MIIFDSSEKRGKSDGVIKDMKFVPWLERETGADAFISPLDEIPFNRGTFMNHMINGAVLIQIKHESDLISSIGERMSESISRMIPITRYAWQRQLVPVGMFHHGEHGNAITAAPINKSKKPYWIEYKPAKKFEALQSACWRWIKRGGVYIPLVHNRAELGHYLQREEIDLREMKNTDKVVYPQLPAIHDDPRSDDPLQRVEIIDDGRVVLASFPGVGKQRASDLWEMDGGVLFTSLMRLSSYGVDLPKGIGQKTVENVREFLGFVDDWEMFEFTIQPTKQHLKIADRIAAAKESDNDK